MKLLAKSNSILLRMRSLLALSRNGFLGLTRLGTVLLLNERGNSHCGEGNYGSS